MTVLAHLKGDYREEGGNLFALSKPTTKGFRMQHLHISFLRAGVIAGIRRGIHFLRVASRLGGRSYEVASCFSSVFAHQVFVSSRIGGEFLQRPLGEAEAIWEMKHLQKRCCIAGYPDVGSS
jgi:hypothetical protein